MAILSTMVAEIMNSPDFAEIMFLVAFILFLIEVLRLVFMSGNTTWNFHWVLVVAGLCCMALGFLALPTGGSA